MPIGQIKIHSFLDDRSLTAGILDEEAGSHLEQLLHLQTENNEEE